MIIKKYFLIFSCCVISIIALLYGVSPQWFAWTFLDISVLDLNIAHIFRAIMCLYLALGLFWLFAAFNAKHRNTAVLTVVIFAGGLVTGRFISVIADGQPQPILILYIALEFIFAPIAYWVFKRPD